MFRRYVFFTAKIWMEQKVEAGISLYRKERTPAEIALQRVVKEPPVFSRKMLCHKKNLIIYLKGDSVYGTHRKQNNYT